jgi:N-acetylmuramic acid 6-phosphate etherase
MDLPPLEGKQLFEFLRKLVTEKTNPRSSNLDQMSASEILELINEEDATVALAVREQIPQIIKAVKLVHRSLKGNGRLIYVGAGTSGRLGILDAAECPPTFGTDPERIVGLIAGGHATLIRSAEGVEDDYEAGARDIDNIKAGKKDIVMGLTSSTRTPYVIAALNRAKEAGAKTILLSCNPHSEETVYDVYITPVVGPELLAGSTRMKAALAEKMVLTMLTTTVMVKLGKVYRNMMVDLQATSQKLIERSKSVIAKSTGCDYETATDVLLRAGGQVKTAIVMAKLGCDADTARKLLAENDGLVYRALK